MYGAVYCTILSILPLLPLFEVQLYSLTPHSRALRFM